MVPKRFRLSASEIRSILRHGVRVESPLFSLLAAPGKREHPGFACIVSKKVSTQAVGRNRIKRILRGGFTNITSTLLPWDIVIIAKRPLLESDSTLVGEQIADAIAQLMKRTYQK